MKSILGLIMATLCAGSYIATAAQAGPLHDAVKRGDQVQVKRLLGDAANIDARARDGATPLIIAVLTRRDAVARLLIARSAGVNAKRKDGVTPLHAAARTGARVVRAARTRALIVRPLGDVIILMPPLSVTDDEITRLVAGVADAIAEVTGT